jgi:hypothetical protein
MDKHSRGKRTAIASEAGGIGFGMYDGFEQEGKTCLLAASAMIPRAPGESGQALIPGVASLIINLS